MENKIIIGVVSVFVAIVVLAGILMPVIDMATEPKQETAEKEGAYGPLLYQGTPESDTYPYRYFNTTYSNGVLSIKSGPANAMVDVASINISELSNTPQIIYADDNQTIYIDNSLLQFSGTITKSDVALNSAVNVQYYNDKMTYSDGSGNQYVDGKITYYYRCSDTGDYANFAGDNPPTMDTPAVSVTGAYIGERYTITDVDPFGANLYNLMPFLVIIAILVSAVVYFIGKSYL